MTELRHAREQVVLDLEVQVSHPPVDDLEWTGVHIHGVIRSISDPIHLRQKS